MPGRVVLCADGRVALPVQLEECCGPGDPCEDGPGDPSPCCTPGPCDVGPNRIENGTERFTTELATFGAHSAVVPGDDRSFSWNVPTVEVVQMFTHRCDIWRQVVSTALAPSPSTSRAAAVAAICDERLASSQSQTYPALSQVISSVGVRSAAYRFLVGINIGVSVGAPRLTALVRDNDSMYIAVWDTNPDGQGTAVVLSSEISATVTRRIGDYPYGLDVEFDVQWRRGNSYFYSMAGRISSRVLCGLWPCAGGAFDGM